MKYFNLGSVLIITQLIALNCVAKIIEDYQYEYYPVDIKANQQYHRATADSSPYKLHDSTVIGLHSLSFSWKWRAAKVTANNRCKSLEFTLYHKTRIHLPELVNNNADEQQARQFHYYAELIHQHELEHYYIAKTYAQRFEKRVIYELSPGRECSKISDEIQRIYDEVMIDYKQQQNDFDARDAKISKIKQISRLLYG